MQEDRNVSEASLQLIMDVEVPISVRFGKKQMALDEILKLGQGSVIELDRMADDPVELLVNQKLLATGEVVVVDGRYAIRITEIVSPAERIESLAT